MNVYKNASPPVGTQKRHSYTALTLALRTNSGWVSVSIDDVAGATRAQKQTAIHAACGRAGLRIETRTTTTLVFIRNMEFPEVQHVS